MDILRKILSRFLIISLLITIILSPLSSNGAELNPILKNSSLSASSNKLKNKVTFETVEDAEETIANGETGESVEESGESIEQPEGSEDQSQESIEESEESTDQSQESIEESEESTDQSQESIEESKESTDQSQESIEESKESTDQSQESIEESQEIATETEAVAPLIERGRAEPISKYNILKISGKIDTDVEWTETLPSNPTDKMSFTTKRTYQREGLTIDIKRRGSVGEIREITPDCEITQIGAPYDVEYDAYGGLVEWSTTNSIKITNPDISQLHIQYVIYTTYGTGGNRRTITRDIYIPLADSRAEAPQSPRIIYDSSHPDSYVLTGIDSSMEYAVTSSPFIKSSFTWEPCTGEDMILTPTNSSKIYLVRYKAQAESGAESQYKELTLPARDAAPIISLDSENEVLDGLTTVMEYRINEGQYTPVTEELVKSVSSIIDGITGSDSIDLNIRLQADNKPAGFDKIIRLYKRLEKPSGVTFDLNTYTLKGTNSGMEYKVDSENHWNSITYSTVNLKSYASPEKDIIVQIRNKATSSNAHSDSLTFTIPKLIDAPAGLAINYHSETIEGFDTTKSYEYTTNLLGNYNKITLTENGEFSISRFIKTSPLTLYIRQAATGDKPYSSYVEISIPARRFPQGIKFVYDDMNTPETQALLQGVNTTIEYRLNSEETWHSVTGESMIFDIPVKDTNYMFRQKATEADFASSEFLLTLKGYQAVPGCYLIAAESIYAVNNRMEYRINDGEFVAVGNITTMPVSEIADSLSANDTCILEFRYMRTPYYPIGKVKSITISPRPAQPVNLTYDTESYTLSGVSTNMEYREAGTNFYKSIGNTSINLKTLVKDRTDVQIEVRYKSVTVNNNIIFASYPTVVNLY